MKLVNSNFDLELKLFTSKLSFFLNNVSTEGIMYRPVKVLLFFYIYSNCKVQVLESIEQLRILVDTFFPVDMELRNLILNYKFESIE